MRQNGLNLARKTSVSLTPETKIGVLLGLSPAGTQLLATWALRMVPAGMPLRGADMSLDMRLFAVSVETAISDGSKYLALGLSDQLG